MTVSVHPNEIRPLLRILREPQDHIVRGREEVSLDADELTRSVELTIDNSRLHHTFLLDIQRPRRGTVVDVDLLSSTATVRQLTHADHVSVSRSLVHSRWLSVFETCQFAPNEHTSACMENTKNRFQSEMHIFLKALVEIPALPPASARVVIDELWGPKPTDDRPYDPLVLRKYRKLGLTWGDQKVTLLCRLVEMLAERYLGLVQVSPEPTKGAAQLSAASQRRHYVINYRYRHRMADQTYDTPEDEPDLRQRVARRVAKLRLTLGGPPSTVRVHTPLAKKCGHYAFSMEAPKDQFFWWGGLLKVPAPLPDRAPPELATSLGGWASSLSSGRRMLLFVGKVDDGVGRLFMGAEAMELPGRSSLRTLYGALVTAVFSTGFFALGDVTDALPIAAGPLVVSIFGLNANAAAIAAPSESVFGTPLQARITAMMLPVLAGLLSAWLMVHALSADANDKALLAWAQDGRFLAVGAAILSAMWLLTLFATARMARTARRFHIAFDGQGDRDNLYVTNEKVYNETTSTNQ